MMLVQIYKNFRLEVPFNHIGHLGPIRSVRFCILLQSAPIARFLKPYLVEDQLHLPLYLKAIQNFQVRLHRKYYRYFQFIMIRFIKNYSLCHSRAASWVRSLQVSLPVYVYVSVVKGFEKFHKENPPCRESMMYAIPCVTQRSH